MLKLEKSVKDSLYRTTIHICVGKDVDYVVRKYGVNKKDLDGCDAAAIGIGEAYLLYFPKFEFTPYYYGNLAHEVFHLAMFILGSKGINIEERKDIYEPYGNNEAFAYFIDTTYREILILLNNVRRRKCKRKNKGNKKVEKRKK